MGLERIKRVELILLLLGAWSQAAGRRSGRVGGYGRTERRSVLLHGGRKRLERHGVSAGGCDLRSEPLDKSDGRLINGGFVLYVGCELRKVCHDCVSFANESLEQREDFVDFRLARAS
jgi:hypothetical protein